MVTLKVNQPASLHSFNFSYKKKRYELSYKLCWNNNENARCGEFIMQFGINQTIHWESKNPSQSTI